jgi:histidine triad (HIT) family protein
MSYDNTNIFARILRAEIPCNKVFENEYALAFHDISPSAPVHVLVVPKGDYVSFDDFVQHAPASLQMGFLQAIQQVASQLGVVESGYRLITNHGADASQTVHHFHVHILAGAPLGSLLP